MIVNSAGGEIAAIEKKFPGHKGSIVPVCAFGVIHALYIDLDTPTEKRVGESWYYPPETEGTFAYQYNIQWQNIKE
jgi:hypothetical protein